MGSIVSRLIFFLSKLTYFFISDEAEQLTYLHTKTTPLKVFGYRYNAEDCSTYTVTFNTCSYCHEGSIYFPVSAKVGVEYSMGHQNTNGDT